MPFFLRISFAVAAFIAVLCPCAMANGQSPRPQAVAGLTQYTFGTPSGDETEILAGINRARSNPAAEGQRLINELNALYPGGTSGINLAQLLADFQGYPARPPLAFNADLNAAAQFHLPEMISLGQETHYSPNGNYFDVRVRSFGYSVPTGENAAGSASYPVSVLPSQVEDNYEIDSTVPGYGHRLNIMEPFTLQQVEVGVAQQALGGWNVEDFGSDYTSTLLVGTGFTDNARTGLYVSGEGVASVVVTAPGASSYYAVTVESGAYTLPLDLLTFNAAMPNPTVRVVFTDALGKVKTQTVTLTHTVFSYGTTYRDASGNVRYDNGEADLIEPATGGSNPTPTPTPVGTPNPMPAAKPDVSIAAVPDSTHFVLTRSGDTSGTLVVSYVVKGTAVAGQDYVPLKGTKKFKPGKSSVSISVQMLPGATGTVKLKIATAADGSYDAPAPAQAKLWLNPQRYVPSGTTPTRLVSRPSRFGVAATPIGPAFPYRGCPTAQPLPRQGGNKSLLASSKGSLRIVFLQTISGSLPVTKAIVGVFMPRRASGRSRGFRRRASLPRQILAHRGIPAAVG